MEISILGNKMRIKIILLCMVIGAFIACNVFFTCAGGIKEGFEMVGAAVDYVMESPITGSDPES